MNENTAGTRDWLTVSEVAARLKISERTVQRRCKNGQLAARFETREDGAAWLIDGATLPTGAAIGADSEAARVLAETEASFLRDALEVSRANETFLRGAIEQHQRSEAELRAALRKALEAMPKQLSGENLQQVATGNAGAQNGLEATKSGAAAIVSGTQKTGGKRAPRSLWRVILGLK